MKFITPFTVVIPFMTTAGIRDYRQLRFEQGPSGQYLMDRRLIRKAIKKVVKQQTGAFVTNDWITHLINSNKWAFRGMVRGNSDNVGSADTGEGSATEEAEKGE